MSHDDRNPVVLPADLVGSLPRFRDGEMRLVEFYIDGQWLRLFLVNGAGELLGIYRDGMEFWPNAVFPDPATISAVRQASFWRRLPALLDANSFALSLICVFFVVPLLVLGAIWIRLLLIAVVIIAGWAIRSLSGKFAYSFAFPTWAIAWAEFIHGGFGLYHWWRD